MHKIDNYEIDIKKILTILTKKKVKRILIQAPDGLKNLSIKLSHVLEKHGFSVVLSGGHAWGGCDIVFDEARLTDSDAIIHIGHHGPVRIELPKKPLVMFVPAFYSVDPTRILLEALKQASQYNSEFKEYVLATTIQHHKWLGKMLIEARKSGFNLKAFPGVLGIDGLIIGCDYTAVKSGDAVIAVAGGVFHGLGAALWSGKPTWIADPYQKKVNKVDTKKILSKHLYNLSLAFDSQSFLIVVSTKPGQFNLKVAEQIKEILEKLGKRAEIGIFDEISRENIMNMGEFDAYINTACPRLAIDDPELFPGPVINPGELKYVLEKNLEDYSPRDLFLLVPRFPRTGLP